MLYPGSYINRILIDMLEAKRGCRICSLTTYYKFFESGFQDNNALASSQIRKLLLRWFPLAISLWLWPRERSRKRSMLRSAGGREQAIYCECHGLAQPCRKSREKVMIELEAICQLKHPDLRVEQRWRSNTHVLHVFMFMKPMNTWYAINEREREREIVTYLDQWNFMWRSE